MEEKEDFLSTRHKQLLDIAIWAKYLAWIIFVFHIILTGYVIIQKQISTQQIQASIGAPMTGQEYWDHALAEPVYYFADVASDMIYVFLRGIVFYVVLKGISLGLHMIIETDINYREKENQRGAS